VKVDVANLLHSTEVAYKKPPEIRHVTMAVQSVVYTSMAIAGIVQLVMLVFVVRYRNESVMKMAQGRFLILLQVAGIIATAGAVLLEPRSDLFCRLSSPIILIPSQFMLAVVFGRLQRIVVIMGSIILWEQGTGSGNIMTYIKRRISRLVHGAGETEGRSVSRSIGRTNSAVTMANVRKSFGVKWLWIYIIGITLPQVIAQIVGIVVFPSSRRLVLNEDETIGRYECRGDRAASFALACIGITFVTLLATVWQAYRSRRLPGLFNEAASVSVALLVTLIVSVFAFTLFVSANDPTSMPDVPFLMMAVIVLVLPLCLSVRLVFPKLKLVWKGEKIVVSKLMAEHREKKRRKTGKGKENTTVGHTSISVVSRPPSSTEQEDVESRGTEKSRGGTHPTGLDESVHGSEPSTFDILPFRRCSVGVGQRLGRGVRILEGEAPPSDVGASMIDLQNAVVRINERLLSGLTVATNEWVELKDLLDESKNLLDSASFS